MVDEIRGNRSIKGDNVDDSRVSVTCIGSSEAGCQWLVTGYAIYKLVARDPRFSADHFHPGFPSVFPVRRRAPTDGGERWRTYSGMDAPDHALHRRFVGPEFKARRVAALRPWIQMVVCRRLDHLFDERLTVDLERDFATPVAAEVIRDLLGVPKDRIDAWVRYSDILVGDGTNRSAIEVASTGFRGELAEFIACKSVAPGNDLTSRLIATYRRESAYAPEQVLEFVGAIFLAGLNSTASMIALGALTLLETPDAARSIASGDPDAVLPVVEELLRFHSIADRVTARVAMESVEIGRHTFHPGDGVVASSAAANRDPGVFSDPDIFDAGREQRNHVAFGYGPHRCLGEHLARMEIEIALSELFARFPRLALSSGYPRPGIDESRVFRGLTAPLMVTDSPSTR